MNRGLRLLLVGGGLLAIALSVPSYYAYNYVEHDPRFCTSCHLMDDAYGRWEKSEHAKIECHACHIANPIDNLKQLYFTFVDPKTKVEKHAEVDRAICLRCHEGEGSDRWRHVLATAGHRVHVTNEKKQCTDCHSETVHRFAPPAKVCLDCHEKVRLHEKMEGLECLDCHNFLTGTDARQALRPGAEECRRCHSEVVASTGTVTAPLAATTTATTWERAISALGVHAKVIPTGSIHEGLDCRRCHNPHLEDPERRRKGKACTECHRGALEKLAHSGSSPHKDCRACHEPHGKLELAREGCPKCHETHSRDLAFTHKGKCETCHLPHDFRVDRNGCKACHADVRTLLVEKGPPEHDLCKGCHNPHGPKPTGEVCGNCHKKNRQVVATAGVPEHRRCTSCHVPHDGKPAREAPCSKCHETEVLGVRSSERSEHAACANCHLSVHGNPETDARACARCHTKQGGAVATFAASEEHRACASCHKPHRASPRADAASCRACHMAQGAGVGGDPHGANCTKCHDPHATRAVKVANCASCHRDAKFVVGSANGHRECKGCHLPHGATPRPPERCAACHEPQAKSLDAWARIQEHGRCINCHERHDPTAKVACGKCHAEKHASTLGTKHAECSACHPPHRSEIVASTAWWANCRKCHEKNASAVATRGSEHSRCYTCHEPHKVTPPTCDSCHNAIRDQLMHRVTAHQQRCQECHDTHGKVEFTRASCARCHEKQKTTHYPESPRCMSCHPFARGKGKEGVTSSPVR